MLMSNQKVLNKIEKNNLKWNKLNMTQKAVEIGTNKNYDEKKCSFCHLSSRNINLWIFLTFYVPLLLPGLILSFQILLYDKWIQNF